MNDKSKTLVLTLSLMALGFRPGFSIEIDLPQSGWRDPGGEKLQFTQQVNYPASIVNVPEGESRYAMIKGRVLRRSKSGTGGEKPHTLIVNGVPMPMRVDGESFERPYLFGPGSNSVEVRGPDGKDRAKVQFYEGNRTSAKPQLSVLLSWDTDQTDLDLHVISPDGRHCWYGGRVADNGGALDVDVTTGFGPEIYSTPAALRGTYLVYVNYYGSGPREDLTVARVTVISRQNTPDEKKETAVVPMRQAGELVLVHSFSVP